MLPQFLKILLIWQHKQVSDKLHFAFLTGDHSIEILKCLNATLNSRRIFKSENRAASCCSLPSVDHVRNGQNGEGVYGKYMSGQLLSWKTAQRSRNGTYDGLDKWSLLKVATIHIVLSSYKGDHVKHCRAISKTLSASVDNGSLRKSSQLASFLHHGLKCLSARCGSGHKLLSSWRAIWLALHNSLETWEKLQMSLAITEADLTPEESISLHRTLRIFNKISNGKTEPVL